MGGGFGSSWGPKTTRGISSPCSLFRKQSFLCAAGDTGKQSWVQVLLGWVEQAYRDGVHMYYPEHSAPTPSSAHQCVKCNDLFKVNPFHLCQFRAYPCTASLSLCSSCLDHKLNLRGKVLV
ncbi:LOW QUALITY PROTEIN: TGFB1-induced anti-apoptotic factor 1 [Pteropus vampyrus]|uniref:LOW QUALITY PROTEIN: TGFB1-induced anti-apoptotic factor 1 n=1 Tax=Pteropus vampyrus TaxID=132908 RepID=A0A6P6CFV7_PTEVA|nr:LOW QUALITY PROTEIN: TGFB1-induced anti-apoptotic factor 1 [Pteropus vampyrus]XP_023386327.1 LOW QUALITY PROTEIN: TGFB1-induced anti-apoptotic factor 1 [Pteropus vampyrus]